MTAAMRRDARSAGWSETLRWFGASAVALACAALLFNTLVDPYGANPLRLRFERPLMDINQRFMYPQVLRSGEYDSAVFGTSTIRLLNPADLEASFGGHFGNFGMNAATPFEQSEAVRLFMAHTPNLQSLIWSLDRSWCEPDAETPGKLLTERAFPPWLYDGTRWAVIPHLFNLRTLEIAARVVLNRLGLMKPRLARNGYEVFTPPEASYDAARAAAHIWGERAHRVTPAEPKFEATPAERSAWRFPALERLGATLAAKPTGARLLAVFPPVHVAIQPVPGTLEAARDEECKARIAKIIAQDHGTTVDMRFTSQVTTQDSNYWDALHYRLPIARRIVDVLREASEGETRGPDFRAFGAGS
ncbi:MAG: hypothetical protein JOZ66_16255 [Hyphomicrobiales bacterium]|nr:hypothetical protein [Hyphomicrobiales bacterium]